MCVKVAILTGIETVSQITPSDPLATKVSAHPNIVAIEEHDNDNLEQFRVFSDTKFC